MHRRDFVRSTAALAVAPLIPRGPGRLAQHAPLKVDGARLNGWIARFNEVGRTATGMNRVAYSEADLAGRAFAMDLMRQAGLTPRIDAAGNIFGRLAGTDASLSPILIGSHVDSVTDGGNYDGVVGSFGAIEVARSLREQNVRLRHPVDVVIWSNEEGGTIGSKSATGQVTAADLDLVARSGKTRREGIAIVGGNPARLADAVLKKGDLACYMELHIEQGGLLDKAGVNIGVVEGIVGLRWFEFTITGFANHAGTTPMDQRQDAMLAAAKFTVAVNEAVRAVPGRTVATVGRVVVTPNTTNIVPGQVVMTVDLRDLDQSKIERFTAQFEQLARDIGAATGTKFSSTRTVDSTPAISDPTVMSWIDGAAAALGLTRRRLPSGAGHDAQEIAHIASMGMIFIPSVGGISHAPREFSRPADIANGASVLLNAVVSADAR
jgi:N-carbamoyl-L-amino-acid hydrolase